MPHYFFLYAQKSNVQHFIEISLKIFTNKLQARIHELNFAIMPALIINVIQIFQQQIIKLFKNYNKLFHIINEIELRFKYPILALLYEHNSNRLKRIMSSVVSLEN
jgi:hypothetical protein